MYKKTVLKTPVVTEHQEMKLVGLRVLCEGDQYIHEIPKASKSLQSQLESILHVVDPAVQIGAFIVDASTVQEDGYWVCVEVENFENVPTGLVTLTIPPQRYASIQHVGRNEEIKDTYERLHKWTQKNGYVRLLNNWHIEVFYSFNNVDQLKIELYDTIQ